MSPFMDHSQHLDQVNGFDLADNPVGIKARFAHSVLVQFRHLEWQKYGYLWFDDITTEPIPFDLRSASIKTGLN